VGRRGRSRSGRGRKNPRTGRRTVYLGHRVPDIKGAGLDTIKEVRGICKAIIQDYRRHRISYRTAMSRLNLLELIIKKASTMRGKKREARKIVDKFREKLMKLRGK